MFGNNIVPRSRSFGNGIKRSLDELAGFGINGDEEIIHVTPGERVLPPSIAQDPQVMLATNAAFKASGLDPSMYVVGDPRSQRNPYTQLSMYATHGEPAPPPPVAPTPPTGMLRGDPPRITDILSPLNPFVPPDSIQALTSHRRRPGDDQPVDSDPGNLVSDFADAVDGFFGPDAVRNYDYPDSENREDFDLPHQDPVANADYHADSSLQQYDDYYHTYLNRHGEEAGIANWSNSGLDAAGIQAGFEGSQEYSNLNPNTTTTTTTGDNHGYEGNDLAVHGFYHTSFGPDRHVESAGLINWTDAINAGMTLEEAAAGIHSSQEGRNVRADVDSDLFDLDATITESIRQAFADLGLNIDGTPLNGDATTPTTSGNGGFVDDADLPFGVRYLRNLRTINADGSVSTGASPISYNAFRTSRRNALVGFGSGILDDRLQ